MAEVTIEHLRQASEDDVNRALDGAYVIGPLSKAADLLEFYNRMLDVMQENYVEALLDTDPKSA